MEHVYKTSLASLGWIKPLTASQYVVSIYESRSSEARSQTHTHTDTYIHMHTCTFTHAFASVEHVSSHVSYVIIEEMEWKTGRGLQVS